MHGELAIPFSIYLCSESYTSQSYYHNYYHSFGIQKDLKPDFDLFHSHHLDSVISSVILCICFHNNPVDASECRRLFSLVTRLKQTFLETKWMKSLPAAGRPQASQHQSLADSDGAPVFVGPSFVVIVC